MEKQKSFIEAGMTDSQQFVIEENEPVVEVTFAMLPWSSILSL